MFCIAAFMIFSVIGIFSARYRTLAIRAWGCTARRLTFRPCEIGFKEELKSQLLSYFIVRRPRLAHFLDRSIEILALVFVVLMLWSTATVATSALNLYVYDTCNPGGVQSCALGGEACSINSKKLGFWESIPQGKTLEWAVQEARGLTELITRVPDRMRSWEAAEYVTPNNSYYEPFDPNKKIALEILDPGCVFCAKQFKNIKEAGFERRYNLTYVAYPISNLDNEQSYKFPHSMLIARYLEAIKRWPPTSARDKRVPLDWQMLERLFTGTDKTGIAYQEKFSTILTEAEVTALLHQWLAEFGYRDAEISKIVSQLSSSEVTTALEQNRELVEKVIRTIKIPTLLFDGRRYDRVVRVDQLK
jgi:hypothetical protein